MTTTKTFRFILGLLGASLSLAIPIFAQPTLAQLDRIAKLVEEGKTEAAKNTVETLLEVYPADPQLSKILTLLGQHKETVNSLPHKPAGPALTTEERLEIGTTIQGVSAAMQIADNSQKAKALNEILARPVPPQSKSGDVWLPYWQSRAVAALELDDLAHGWPAAQSLKMLGALESSDPNIGRLMASLNLKGWLGLSENTFRQMLEQKSAIIMKQNAWAGTWQGKGANGRTLTLKIESRNGPQFASWESYYEEITAKSIIRKIERIPGASVDYFAFAPTGVERYRDSTNRKVTSAEFDADYTRLNVSIAWSVGTSTGEDTRSFRLLHDAAGVRVIDQDSHTYFRK